MTRHLLAGCAVLFTLLLQAPVTPVFAAGPPGPPWLRWTTVVNNNDVIPGTVSEAYPEGRNFNSYNQPSVNDFGLVVFRARSQGGTGNEPAHGIYLRDMAEQGDIIKILDKNTGYPNPTTSAARISRPPPSRASTSIRTASSPGGIISRCGNTSAGRSETQRWAPAASMPISGRACSPPPPSSARFPISTSSPSRASPRRSLSMSSPAPPPSPTAPPSSSRGTTRKGRPRKRASTIAT